MTNLPLVSERRCSAASARLALLAAVLAAAAAPVVHAGTLQAFSGVVGGAGNGSIAGGCTTYGPPSELAFFGGAAPGLQVLGGNAACGYGGGYSNLTSSAPAPLGNSASLAPTVLGNPGFAESFAGTASSRATFGSLSAGAHGGYSGSPASYTSGTTVAVATGAASFSDTLTAAVAPAYTALSSAGFVRYRFAIDGTLSTPGVPAAYTNGEAVTAFDIQHDHGPIFSLLSAETTTGAIGTISAPGGWTISPGLITGGSVVQSGLFAIDLSTSWDFMAGLIVDAYGNADDDFMSTARLIGVDLFDYTGAAISDFSLTGSSGTSYVSPIVAVPEPASLSLMFAGMLGITAWHQRRRKQRAEQDA